MKKSNFAVGIGIGAVVGGALGAAMTTRKKPKNIVGRTLKTMGEVADAFSASMGL